VRSATPYESGGRHLRGYTMSSSGGRPSAPRRGMEGSLRRYEPDMKSAMVRRGEDPQASEPTTLYAQIKLKERGRAEAPCLVMCRRVLFLAS